MTLTFKIKGPIFIFLPFSLQLTSLKLWPQPFYQTTVSKTTKGPPYCHMHWVLFSFFSLILSAKFYNGDHLFLLSSPCFHVSTDLPFLLFRWPCKLGITQSSDLRHLLYLYIFLSDLIQSHSSQNNLFWLDPSLGSKSNWKTVHLIPTKHAVELSPL